MNTNTHYIRCIAKKSTTCSYGIFKSRFLTLARAAKKMAALSNSTKAMIVLLWSFCLKRESRRSRLFSFSHCVALFKSSLLPPPALAAAFDGLGQ